MTEVNVTHLYQAVFNYLDERGLTTEDGDRFKFNPCSTTQALKKVGNSLFTPSAKDLAITIQYWDIFGNPRVENEKLLHCARLVTNEIASYQPPEGKRKKKPKLFTPSGDSYLNYCGLNFHELPVGSTVFLCESFFKAITLIKLGYNAIAANGIFGWSYDHAPCKDLLDVPWREREYKLVFFPDSNVIKKKLAIAPYDLAAGMEGITDVYLLTLPPRTPGDHWGVDDAFMRHGEEWLHELLQNEEGYELIPHDPIKLVTERLNAGYTFVGTLGTVFSKEKPKLAWTTSNFKNEVANVKVKTRNEKGELVEGPALPHWFSHDDCDKAHKVAYHPGEGRLFTDRDDIVTHNQYTGWAVEPCYTILGAMKARPLLKWLKLALSQKGAYEWIIQRFAFDLQYPEHHLFTVPTVVGSHGVGKGTIFVRLLRNLTGTDNLSSVTPEQYVNRFRPFMNSAFIIVDENKDAGGEQQKKISASAKMEVVKRDTGDDFIVLEYKHTNIGQEVRAFFTIILIANELDGLDIQDNDRRLAIVNVDGARDLMLGMDKEEGHENAFATELDAATRDPEVLGVVMHWLLALDLSGFDAFAPAPVFGSGEGGYKEEARRDKLEDWERLVEDAVEDPDLLWGPWPTLAVVSGLEFATRVWFALGNGIDIPSWLKKSMRSALTKNNALNGKYIYEDLLGKRFKVGSGRNDYWYVVRPDLWAGLVEKDGPSRAQQGVLMDIARAHRKKIGVVSCTESKYDVPGRPKNG